MDDFLNSFQGESALNAIRAASPKYDAGKDVAANSPFGDNSVFARNVEGPYEDLFILSSERFDLLQRDIASNLTNERFWFDFENYNSSILPANNIFVPVASDYPYVNEYGEEKIGKFYTGLNARIGEIAPGDWSFAMRESTRGLLFEFELSFYYTGTKKYRKDVPQTSSKTDFTVDDRYKAIKLITTDANAFISFGEDILNSKALRSKVMDFCLNHYRRLHDVTDLKKFYEQAPSFVIKEIGKVLLWNDLVSLLEYDAEGWFSWFRDSSNGMINIVKAFCETEPGIAYLHKKFDEDQAKVKQIYEHLQGDSIFDEQELPNKTVFASLVTALTDLQITQILDSDATDKKHPRDRTDVLFKLTDGYRVDSNIAAADESDDTFVLTQQKRYEEERSYTAYPMGGSSGRSGTYNHVEWRNEPGETHSLHPMDIVMVELRGPFGFPMTVPLPAIYVKDVAHHEEWGRVMQGIRFVANLLIIVVSVATILSGAGLLLTTFAWIDLGLALGDITVQAFEKELRKTEWGKKFLEIWDAIYTIGGFVTVAPMIGNLLVNGAKAFTKLINGAAQLRLANMLEFAISRSQKFKDFLVAGQFRVVFDFSDFAKDLSRKLAVLRAEGFILLQDVKAFGSKVSDQIGEKFHLIYWDTIIYTAETLDDLKNFLNRVVKNGKVVFKEIEEFSLEQFYKKGYKYVEMGMPSKNIIKTMFGQRGQKLVSLVDREVARLKKMIDPETGQVISNNKLRDRMLVAGIACRKHTTKIFLHTNYPKALVEKYLKANNLTRGAFEIADIKKFYRHLKEVGFIKNELHPLLEARIKKHIQRAQGGIKHSDNYRLSQTGGIPGAHAEILSINEMLWKLESKGVNLDARIFTEMMGFNKAIVPENVMIRCLDCHFISFNVPFIEKIIPKKIDL